MSQFVSHMSQPIACGVSFKPKLQSRFHQSLFKGTWHKRPRERDQRLRFETYKNDTPDAVGCVWVSTLYIYIVNVYIHCRHCIHTSLSRFVSTIYLHECTANPTWGDIFAFCFKAQSSKLGRLFSLKRGKRDVRAWSFELSKMSPQVGLAVHVHKRPIDCLCCRSLFIKETYKRDLLTVSHVISHVTCDKRIWDKCVYMYVYTHIYMYTHLSQPTNVFRVT